MSQKTLSPRDIAILKEKATSASDIVASLENDDEEDMISMDYSSAPKFNNTYDALPLETTSPKDKDVFAFVPEEDTEKDDLDSELEELEAEVQRQRSEKERATASESEAEPAGASMQDRALEALFKVPGGPTKEQIALWKKEHGDSLNLLALSERELFVFTPIRKVTWDKIQRYVRAKQEQQEGNESFDPNAALQMKVISTCVLFPEITERKLMYAKAGLLPTLFEAIMTSSYFLNQQQIMMLTYEL